MKVKSSVIATIAHYGTEMGKELLDILKEYALSVYGGKHSLEEPAHKSLLKHSQDSKDL